MMRNDGATDVFVTGLRNAHAVESQAHQLLSRQVERLENYPKLEARMRQHIDETKQQMERLEHILSELDDSPSSLKDAALALAANVAALSHSMAEDEILKNSLASFASENYEIATYRSLLVTGEAAGLDRFRGPLEQSLAEEQAMADFLAANLDDTVRTYLARESAGVKAGV
jgi:ferritin-like metal-binding protein YciE